MGAKIVVVDDDPATLAIVETTLAAAGHQAVATSDPHKTMMLVVRERADVIVLDLLMSGLSGWEVLDMLRRDPVTQDIPVILLSGVGDTATRIRGLRAGANDFVVKPFDPDELVVRIGALLARRVQTSASLQGQLAAHPVPELVETLEREGKTGELEIFGPDGRGRIVFAAGQIVGAEALPLTGREALFALLEQTTGSFTFRVQARVEEAEGSRFSVSPRQAVIESVWIGDELARRRPYLPADGDPLSATGHAPGEPSEALAGLPLASVLGTISEAGDPTLGDLLARRIAAPNRVRLAVAWLIEAGAVVGG